MNVEALKKKILYKSIYRGTRENDLLIRNFIINYIENLNDEDELKKLDDFLDLFDQIIFEILGKKNCEIYIKYQKIFDELEKLTIDQN